MRHRDDDALVLVAITVTRGSIYLKPGATRAVGVSQSASNAQRS